MKKLFALLIGLSMTGAALADTNEEVLKTLQQMQEQIRQQQQEIAELRQELGQSASEKEMQRQIQQEVKSAIDTTSWSQSKDVAGITLSSHIKDLKLKGDLRLRYERQERDRHRNDPLNPSYDPDYDEETRDRFRTRLRIGAEWKTSEGWDVGVGLATGGSGATSTNDTWSDGSVFETGDLRLDYAYAKHKLMSEEDFTLTAILGQQKNPFESSSLFWDGDVRPTGATLKAEAGGLFLTTGAYVTRHIGRDEANAGLFAGQVGFAGEIAEDHEVTLATSYYHYTNPTDDLLPTMDLEFRIVDLYGNYGMKVGDVGIGLEGHVWKNLGADGSQGMSHVGSDDTSDIDPEDADMGYVLGVSAKLDKFSLGYSYGYVEADSVWGAVKDSDFGDTAGLTDTDVKGHKISAGYKVTKNFALGLTYMDVTSIDGFDRDGELYQLDFKYKF